MKIGTLGREQDPKYELLATVEGNNLYGVRSSRDLEVADDAVASLTAPLRAPLLFRIDGIVRTLCHILSLSTVNFRSRV